jgi:phosphoglycolate phosphatase
MSAIRHVIFDLDGTLVDSVPGIAFSIDSALRACGFPASRRELAPLIGPPVREILAAVSGAGNSEALDRLERAFRASYDVEGWRRTEWLPGVPDMLWNLMTGGIVLWVATNKPALPTGRILSELNLAGFFREVACRDSRFASKAALLIDLLARNGMNRDECLMVGDTAEDGRAAEAAGIACVIVNGANWDELESMVGQSGGADFSLRRASARQSRGSRLDLRVEGIAV